MLDIPCSDCEGWMKLNNFPIITGRRLRVGLVGCGRISKNHFDSIFQLQNDLELISVCDVDADTLKAETSKHNVKGYKDLRDMLSSETLDLLVLCTPSGLHPKQAILAAEHGVHVISENQWQLSTQMA